MLPRHIEQEIRSHLEIMPVVLIIGARQTGKTTLVESLMKQNHWHYVTFDDEMTLALAQENPADWISSLPKPVIIDEIQRVPEIFLSIKRDVDKHRAPGRYLLTGSANPLLLPKLGDSLAGRMGIVTLYPFSQGELNRNQEHFISNVFEEKLTLPKCEKLEKSEFIEIILRGGFPTVCHLKEFANIARWVKAYLQTMTQRDVRDISNIEGLKEFPRLFRLLATRSGMILNYSDLSRTLGMVNMTLNRYLKLLEILFFIYLLPAWYTNLGKRLLKSPKVHICDTAIMAQLLEVDVQRLQEEPILLGQFLETFIFTEFLKQKSWTPFNIELYHFRDGDHEVDLVLEKTDGYIVGVEIKSTTKIRRSDLKGLMHLKSITKNHFKRGIVLYLGETVQFLSEDIIAMPIQAVWT